uniref:ATP-binding protein n=1 Tax=Oceanicella sp. SM1341 TaxID=1548889 RepID=UPI000E4B9991
RHRPPEPGPSPAAGEPSPPAPPGPGPTPRRPAPPQSMLRSGLRSPLARRIIGINMIALGALVCGILYLTRFEDALLRERTSALATEARLVAGSIAMRPGNELKDRLLPAFEQARLFQQVSGSRLQIFDRAGRLVVDTGEEPAALPNLEVPLPPEMHDGIEGAARPDLFTRLGALITDPDTPDASAAAAAADSLAGAAPSDDPRVRAALVGRSGIYHETGPDRQTIIAAAIPIEVAEGIIGVVRVATRRGDIDDLIRYERNRIIQMAAVAAAISVLLSLVLANTIALPIRRLAAAAERGQGRSRRFLDPGRIQIPDLTARRDEIGHLSGAMRGMTAALLERVEATERFAADVAHEIRNPLTSLRSAVETLRVAPGRGPARQRLMRVIETDVMRLDRLVTDISNSSRLDSEMGREDRTTFSLTGLLRMLTEVEAPPADGRRGHLLADLPADPLLLTGLETRLARVFINLIDNAVSFLPPGGLVVVSARRAPGGDIEVSVRDTGPGLPPENLDDIFRRFYSERPEQEFGGHSGLGLSISRQIVDAHGGRIWAENRPARPDGSPGGACFRVELPR